MHAQPKDVVPFSSLWVIVPRKISLYHYLAMKRSMKHLEKQIII